MFKRNTLLCLLLIASANVSLAADMNLQVTLPDMELVLAGTSPPQMLKEGLPLPQEQQLVTEYLAFFDRGEYEAGLDLIRARFETTLDLLENGDPEFMLPQRAVIGGLIPTSRSNQISSTMLYLIGYNYTVLENYTAAEAALKAALIPVPDYIRVHESLGLLYLRTDRFEEALVHLSKALTLGLHTSNLFGSLGYLNQRIENYWGAISSFQQALMMDPDNKNWQKGLLFALSQSHQSESALTLVEQMLQKEPDSAELWVYRSNFSLQSGNREAALTSLETAIRLGDDQVAHLQVCATLHMELGSIARAVDLLKTGFTKEMDFVFVAQAMNWLKQKNEWAYLDDLLKSMREDWDNLNDSEKSIVLLREAEVNLHDEEVATAASALQEAINLDPSNDYALLVLAGIRHDEKNYNQAEILYQRASAYTLTRESALISLAQLAVDQDNFERALRLLRDVLRENPDRSDLSRNIDSLENLVLLQTEN